MILKTCQAGFNYKNISLQSGLLFKSGNTKCRLCSFPCCMLYNIIVRLHIAPVTKTKHFVQKGEKVETDQRSNIILITSLPRLHNFS